MIKCPNCAAELAFDAGSQMVKCPYCKSEFNPNELNEKVSKSEESNDTYEGKSYLCSQCGAKLLTFDETAITFCSYCGSQAMIESKMIKQNSPDYIIPFKKTREECINAYKKMVSKSLFAPKYMKSDITLSKFRGIYMPYVIYTLSHKGDCINKGRKYSHRSGDYVYYDLYEISSNVDAEYDGLSYDLISNFYDKYSLAIPFNFKESEKFNPNYLSGFYADTMDVENYVYNQDAEVLVQKDSTSKMRKNHEFSRYGCSSPKVKLQVSDKKTGMCPLYFLAIRSKNNEYIHYAIVNGQTGKCVADMPIDFKKYFLASLIITLPIFILINSFTLFLPKTICVFAIISAIISIIISMVQLNQIDKNQNHKDDIGYKNAGLKIEKSKIKSFKYIYKQILGIIIGIITLLVNFVNDIYYYGSCIIILSLIIISFYGLVQEHNLVVSSKIPQLNKRGGDENE